ncbi:HRDC domain-containing protein [Acetobacterium sp.]|uniref:HRDC domain-containing protein n=1 Tax=Acetobacterium sp. TaxID=1872094 RepID=UPI002F402253
MALFNKLNTPIFLKEGSDTTQYLNRLKELQDKATGKVKDDIAREINLANYGEIGEKNIAFELKNSGMPMYIIHDLHLEFEELSAQIDYVVVTRKLIFFIECKNLFGNIDIDSQGNFIRNYSWNGKTVKEGIYSPITQNQRHLEVYKQLNRSHKKNIIMRFGFEKVFDSFHKSIVVLANPKTVLNAKYAKKDVKDKVIRADQLIAYIKNAEKQSKELANSEKGMKELAEGLLAYHTPSQSDYAKKYEDIINSLSLINENQKAIQFAVAEKTSELIPATVSSQPTIPDNDKLVSKLKAFRLEKSREENIKAYCVFSDKHMQDLISKMPRSREELLGVSGFGPVKVEKYGDVIIQLLK